MRYRIKFRSVETHDGHYFDNDYSATKQEILSDTVIFVSHFELQKRKPKDRDCAQ